MEESVNNLSFWFPKIRAAGLPVPETRIVETSLPLMNLLDGEHVDGFDDLVAELQADGHALGYPCFLRTGYLSGKHEWSTTCYVESPEVMAQHVVTLVEESAMAGLMGLPVDTWVVRELIPTEPLFTMLRYSGMPFVPEWRVFATGERVTHVQPYWPMDAIEASDPDNEDWRDLVLEARLTMERGFLRDGLAGLAIDAAEACGGEEWSVDFLWSAVEEKWWLTDMADGARSFRCDP